MGEIRCVIELRGDESRQSPGKIVGALLTYGKQASDRPEMFAAGALKWEKRGVVLNEMHDRRSPIMRFTPTVEGREVRIDAALPDTQRGRDLATLIRNGTLTGLSVEFQSLSEVQRGGVREILAATLTGAAVVDSAAYKGALEVRDRKPGVRRLPRWL